MTYQEAMLYIDASGKYGSVLGLENIKKLLEKLRNPQEQLNMIHIAGTNGKGSTASYISHILAAAGYKIGRYISPVIFEYRECIQIVELNADTITTNYISEQEVANQVQKIKIAIDEMLEEGDTHPTTFEIETVMSFLYFLEQDCQVVVLEVGMGGRLDATNVIKNSLCSVLTSISMDHMQFLGETLEKITIEKAGIFKESGLAVCYDYQKDKIGKKEEGEIISKTIDSIAKEKESNLIYADFSKIKNEIHSLDGITFSYKEYDDIKLNLLGENQVKNAALAVEVIEQLNQYHKLQKNITKEHIYQGLERTQWKGRFSVVSKEPLMIVDGAHNEGAAKSLLHSLELYLQRQKCIFVIGVFADKEYDKVLQITSEKADTIITIRSNHVRALSSEELADCAKKYCNHVIDGKTVKNGLQIACEISKEQPIITFGSLSFIKEVYEFIDENYRNK